jgi:hypothetical protein
LSIYRFKIIANERGIIGAHFFDSAPTHPERAGDDTVKSEAQRLLGLWLLPSLSGPPGAFKRPSRFP